MMHSSIYSKFAQVCPLEPRSGPCHGGAVQHWGVVLSGSHIVPGPAPRRTRFCAPGSRAWNVTAVTPTCETGALTSLAEQKPRLHDAIMPTSCDPRPSRVDRDESACSRFAR